jgi:DNA invertase Pin-like site-specific DNA recombinase
MVRQLRQRKAQGLVIHKIDRSARNFADWAKIGELSDSGIAIHFATETLDFRSRGGRLTADIQAVIAADYIRNLREECIKGLNGRLKQGLYPFRAPIGYLDNGRGNPKTPDPVRAKLIRELFTLYASGRYSLISLQSEMDRLGLRNYGGNSLSINGIVTVLDNPFYSGLIRIKRTGKTYPGIHKKIISAALFERTQDVRAGRSIKRNTKHNHTYRGMFRCALCKSSMIPELQKGHVYYRCQRPDCPTKTVREEVIDVALQRLFNKFRHSLKQQTKLKAGLQKWIQQDNKSEERISHVKCKHQWNPLCFGVI